MKYAFISSNIEQFKVILKVCCFVVQPIGTMLLMGRKRLNRLAKLGLQLLILVIATRLIRVASGWSLIQRSLALRSYLRNGTFGPLVLVSFHYENLPPTQQRISSF